MKAHIRISLKDLQHNKNLKVQLARADSLTRPVPGHGQARRGGSAAGTGCNPYRVEGLCAQLTQGSPEGFRGNPGLNDSIPLGLPGRGQRFVSIMGRHYTGICSVLRAPQFQHEVNCGSDVSPHFWHRQSCPTTVAEAWKSALICSASSSRWSS